MPLSYVFWGGAAQFFVFFWWPLASCIVLGSLLGFGLLVINYYLSKKKKEIKTSKGLGCLLSSTFFNVASSTKLYLNGGCPNIGNG